MTISTEEKVKRLIHHPLLKKLQHLGYGHDPFDVLDYLMKRSMDDLLRAGVLTKEDFKG